MVHQVTVRQEIIDRVLARRGRHHLYESLIRQRLPLSSSTCRTCFANRARRQKSRLHGVSARSINRLCDELREMGGLVIWITSATTSANGKSDWEHFIRNFVAEDIQERTIEALKPGGHGEQIWEDLEVKDNDLIVRKNRYSCLTPGSSMLQSVLSSQGIRNVLIGGTKTNICCESTGRDAMMLDYNVVMVEDCNAALSDDEHRSALENVIQQFGDVMTVDEVTAVFRNRQN